MAISDKVLAQEVLDQQPDDASFDDIMYAMFVRKMIGRGPHDIEAANTVSQAEVMREVETSLSVPRRLVRKGRLTVLEPVHPVPPLTVEIVNESLDEVRREREDRFLGLTDRDS